MISVIELRASRQAMLKRLLQRHPEERALHATHDVDGAVVLGDVVVAPDHHAADRKSGEHQHQQQQRDEDHPAPRPRLLRGGGSGSTAGRLAAAATRFGLKADARPAAVLGGAVWSSSPDTAPARIGWVWPYS